MPNGSFALLTRLIFLGLLAGCTASVRAPIVDLSAGSAPPPTVPIQAVEPVPELTRERIIRDAYIVKPGDTLYGIARATGASVASLTAWNQISDPTQLRVGQALTLHNPAVTTQAKPVAVTPKPIPPRPAEAVTPPKKAASQPTPVTVKADPKPNVDPKPNPSKSAPKSEPVRSVADAKSIRWDWPASGNVIQAFNATNKGIDIAGAPGDPVRAAADGKVMYSGNGVRGLGNLLIINHQNGFITAYAHNRALLVKTGQEVKRGAKIAELGQSDTTSPRLHFEVRRQGTPVNPLQYLPPR